MSATLPETSEETDVPDLIPARMLNEFAYCPRLAYLEWVQGEFTDNLETLEGRFGHRRVDAPSRQEVPDPPAPSQSAAEGDGSLSAALPDSVCAACGDGPSEDPSGPLVTPNSELPTPNSPDHETIHARSVMLSAPEEGLIARMDLIDLQAGVAVPVDYKRGQVPDVPGGAYEPEQVQLCAQGLILRANGYQCEGGVLYFIQSRRRVSVPFTDDLVERTRALLAEFRRTASDGRIPPPLDDSPKCPRCSLVGICLPDETRLLAQAKTEESTGARPEVRRLMPARDDALPLYLQEQGTTLGKSGDRLTVKRRQEVLQDVKLIDVSQVCVFGNVQITAQALRELTAVGVPICHLSYGGWFHGLTTGLIHKNVELRIAQFAAAADPARSLELARRFIAAKIRNCRTLLRRHLGDSAEGTLLQLAELIQKAENATDPAALLGIEGTAAREYFAGLARMLKTEAAFHLDGRNRRPPRDPVNALLSFVYALLVKELTIVLHATGLDPMLGMFHRPRYGRPSLALDLAEEFRPLVADSTVLMLINNGEVNPASFLHRAGGVALTDAGRRAVLSAFERRLDGLVTHPIFGYRVSYRRILEVQTRLLARCLLGEIGEYPGFCTR